LILVRARQRNKRDTNRKVRTKIISKHLTKIFLDLINTFGKIAEYKNNKNRLRKKSGKKILFTIALKKIIYLVINLTNEVKNFYNENHKMLKKLKTVVDRKTFLHS
jgi:hypothetical protein